MIDITLTEITPVAFFYCFFMFLVTYFIGLKQVSFSPYGIKSAGGKYLLYSLLFVILMTAFNNTDYFSYQTLTRMTVGHDTPHLEDVYGYIIEYCGYNYLLFRVVVWGGALLLVGISTRIARVSIPHVLFLLFLFFFPTFDYARATLAMSIYFLGYVMISNEKQKGIWKLLKLLGIGLIIGSYYFHKSMAGLIVLTPIIFLPLNKKTMWLLLISTPVVLLLIKAFLSNLLLTDFADADLADLNKTFSQYTERDDLGVANWKGMLSAIFAYGLFYVPLYYISASFLKSKESSIFIQRLFKITLAIMLLCHSMFLLGAQSYSLYYRYLYMSMIPMSILLVALYEEGGIDFRSMKKLINIGFICRLMLLLAASVRYI